MKKTVLAGILLAGLLLVAGIVYFTAPAVVIVPPKSTAVIVPAEKVAVIVPVPVVTPEVPKVIFIGITTISPLDLATNQGLHNNIVVTFSEAMDPATINENTFMVKGSNNVNLKGLITSDATKKVWTFNPTDTLKLHSVYTITVTTGAKGVVSGNSLVENFVASFTTTIGGGGSGPSPPSPPAPPSPPPSPPVLTTITLSPTSANLTVGSTQQLTATSLDQFGSPIAATINYATSNSSVANVSASGLVTAVAAGNATITGASGAISNTSLIRVIGPSGPAIVNLGEAIHFAVLSKTAISDVPLSVITGDVGISPAAGTFITGLTCPEVNGGVGFPIHVPSGASRPCDLVDPTYLTPTILEMEAAFTDANSRAPNVTELDAGVLSGQTLVPGVYFWSSSVGITTSLTLDCQGNENGTFIFQIAGNLNVAASTHVILSGNCQAKNIFWAVSGLTNIGGGSGTESTFEGTIITGPGTTEIQLITGSTVHGRLLGAKTIALQQNIITVPS